MKTFFKVIGWILAFIVALIIYYAIEEKTRVQWILGFGVGYAIWLVLKQMTEAEQRTSARLDRIEDLIRRQQDEGLSVYDREGLAEMIRDHRESKRPWRDTA